MKTVKCAGPNCGREIVWGVNEQSAKVPLDPSAPCYTVTGVDPDGTIRVRRAGNAMVSHFKTCPDAGKFSRGAR